MLGMDLPLWLRGVHGLLLAVVIYTDLTRHKVYLPWSGVALLVGIATALFAPWPMVNLVLGALGFLWGLYGLSRQHWAGGDVWMLTYLGLSFGLDIISVLVLGTLVLLAGLAWRTLEWGQTIPLAGIWGLAAASILLISLVPLPAGAQTDVNAPLSTTHPPLTSPPPTPTVDPLLVSHAQQAADAVALVGLVNEEHRSTRAQHAARTLRTLAQTTPDVRHAWLLTWWADALEQYAAGHPAALTFIKQFNQVNHTYRKGDIPDAH
jgi:hypothetical protein